jgi:uncharacterized membrane protein
MSKDRLEAFSDGVFAVIITIMVLDMKVPRGADLQALKTVLPVFLSYVLSYVFVGIYWNNHHHLLHAAERVTGGILWANLILLFCLSLAPFTTAWMGENNYAPLPVAMYGMMLLCAGIACFALTRKLIARHGKDSLLAQVNRQGLEGLRERSGLHACDSSGIRQGMGGLRLLRLRGSHVAFAGSTHRKTCARLTLREVFGKDTDGFS